MINAISQFRKKYTLALLLYVSGTALAFYSNADLGSYTLFAGALLAIFGGSDLIDKKVPTKGE